MDIKLALRASYVMRWTIVEMGRPQSIAEHQWRVWLLSTMLWDTLFDTPINMDRDTLQNYALTHDMAEVLTGDIPTPAKKLIGKAACETAEEIALMSVNPALYHLKLGVRGTLVENIVKIADLMESITYLEKWGQDKSEVIRISYLLQQDLREKLLELQNNAKSGKWLVHKLTQFDQYFEQFMDRSPGQMILNVEAKKED